MVSRSLMKVPLHESDYSVHWWMRHCIYSIVVSTDGSVARTWFWCLKCLVSVSSPSSRIDIGYLDACRGRPPEGFDGSYAPIAGIWLWCPLMKVSLQVADYDVYWWNCHCMCWIIVSNGESAVARIWSTDDSVIARIWLWCPLMKVALHVFDDGVHWW